jgi:hypothetical protein
MLPRKSGWKLIVAPAGANAIAPRNEQPCSSQAFVSASVFTVSVLNWNALVEVGRRLKLKSNKMKAALDIRLKESIHSIFVSPTLADRVFDEETSKHERR